MYVLGGSCVTSWQAITQKNHSVSNLVETDYMVPFSQGTSTNVGH